MPHQGKNRINANRPHRHPPGLSGREIGLWYAAHSRKHNESNTATNLDLTGINVEKILTVIREAQTSGVSTSVPLKKIEENTKIQLCPSGGEPDLYDTNELFGEMQDSLDISFDPSPDSDPMLAFGDSLIRNTELDDELRNCLLDQQRSPGYQRLLAERTKLPTFLMKEELVSAISANQIVVVSGETGCGKTTQIPQYLLEQAIQNGEGSVTRILVTQPRRISAISVAERVAAERGESISNSVGYQIRLERRLPRRIPGSITFCTTGIILQWLRSDPLLKTVSHLIVDEVHEREFLCDFLLNILRRIAPLRPDLHIVLMSATLNANKFSDYFGGCPKLEIKGRLFPVQDKYLEEIIPEMGFWLSPNNLRELARAQSFRIQRRLVSSGAMPRREAKRISAQSNDNLDAWLHNQPDLPSNTREILRVVGESTYPGTDLIVHLVDYILRTTSSGAVLVFVPGFAAILETMQGLRQLNPQVYGDRQNSPVRLYPLHSQLATSRQRQMFEVPPQGQRKVIIATNIAETSVTIEDVVYVIDSGQIKVHDFDPKQNTSSLAPVLISQANATQRRGRAGRVRPGICFHLFTRYVKEKVMAESLPPEMLRIRLDEVILRIKLLGLEPVTSFLESCLDPPSAEAVQRTLHFLRDIQALEPLPAQPSLNHVDCEPHAKRPPPRLQLRDLARMAVKEINSGNHTSSAASLLTSSASSSLYQSRGTSVTSLQMDNDRLTALGEHLAALPLEPQCAKLVLLGALFSCLEPALVVAACLTYRDPFEIPLERENIAKIGRHELAKDSQSDHWIYVAAIQAYRRLTSPCDRRSFCDKYFLRENIIKDILSLLNDFARLLYERRYIASPSPLDLQANRNKDNMKLFRAILCGALYPNILSCTPKLRNGIVKRPMLSGRPSEPQVDVHARSVNAEIRPIYPVWMVYFTKTKLDNSLRPTIFDTTLVPLRPVLFFGGNFEPIGSSRDSIKVDQWITVNASPKVARLVKDLRNCLDNVLKNKFSRPSVTDWSPDTCEGRVLNTIVELLTSEPLPSLHQSNGKVDHDYADHR